MSRADVTGSIAPDHKGDIGNGALRPYTFNRGRREELGVVR
jgi:hypothetical protein